jgi:predicted nucleic acid-binding protein
MSGTRLLADTNALIYILEGHSQYQKLCDEISSISVISEIELLGYHGITQKEIKHIKLFLSSFEVFELTPGIKEIAIELKQKQRIKLPDAVIAATSIYHNLVLLTSDKEFSKIEGLDLILVDI